MKKIPLLLLIFLNLVFLQPAFAEDRNETNRMARFDAWYGDIGPAFLNFKTLVELYPDSRYAADALFASGEYYYTAGDERSAAKTFMRLLNDFPDYKGTVFVLAYIFKLAENQGEKALANTIANKIATSERLVFLFKDYKKYRFTSPLNRHYEAVYRIDNIEFLMDGKLFAKVAY